MTPNGDVVRIHERIDQVMGKLTEIAESQAEIAATCIPCQAKIAAHELAINGNGIANGLKSRVSALEEITPKADTLSIKAILWLLGGVGTLATAIATAIATVAGKS